MHPKSFVSNFWGAVQQISYIRESVKAIVEKLMETSVTRLRTLKTQN